MLKSEIREILQEVLTDEQEHIEVLDYIADRVVDACIDHFIPLIGHAIANYENKRSEDISNDPNEPRREGL